MRVRGGHSCVAVVVEYFGRPRSVCVWIISAGVYGASVGTAVLDAMGVGSDNLVPRGIAMGASAHSIGTAALMEQEPEVCCVHHERHATVMFGVSDRSVYVLCCSNR